MPVQDLGRVAERALPELPVAEGMDSLVAQAREATVAPSPLVKILQDPILMRKGSREWDRAADYGHKSKSKSSQRQTGDAPRESRSRSPHPGGAGSREPSRDGRGKSSRHHKGSHTPMVMAIALAEEEKQAVQLKALLRHSADRLEYEMQRADEAALRAEYAERREKELLGRLEAVERSREEERAECVRLERESRDFQMQLENAQREIRRLRGDLGDAKREVEELQALEMQSQEMYDKTRVALREVQHQAMLQTEEDAQRGYELGYAEGRRSGVKRRKEVEKQKKQKQKQRAGGSSGVDEDSEVERWVCSVSG